MPRPWRIQWEGCWYHVTFWERNVGPCAERFKSTPIYRGVKLSPIAIEPIHRFPFTKPLKRLRFDFGGDLPPR